MNIENYLTALITEKGASIHDEINLPGHFGLTWETLINFIGQHPEYHQAIRTTLVKIDFKAGDVFHYLTHLATGMVKAWGY